MKQDNIKIKKQEKINIQIGKILNMNYNIYKMKL